MQWGPVANFSRPVCELRERAVWANCWLWIGLSSTRSSTYSWAIWVRQGAILLKIARGKTLRQAQIHGQWRYLYRAIDKHGTPVDFLLTATRDLEAAKRFFRKMLQDEPLLGPDRIGTGMVRVLIRRRSQRPARPACWRAPLHYVTKHLQQGIESDHFRVKKNMPRIGGFQAFHIARRTIQGFEAMLWLRKGFGFVGAWTVREQNRLLALCFGFPQVNKA